MNCRKNNKTPLPFSAALFFFAVFSLVPAFCLADVVISEIMYDPKGTDANAGGEWIEVHNTGADSVDLTKWYFYDNETNHGITTDGVTEVPADGYAVISSNVTNFKNFFTGYTGLIFKASFSLNDGEPLAMKSAKDAALSGAVTYSSDWGAKNDGNSLQLSGGNWIAAVPTPGAPNVSAGSQPPPNNQDNPPPAVTESTTASSTASSSGSVNRAPVEPQIFAFITGDKSAIVGVESIFKGSTFGLDKKPIENARYLWSFGDGTVKEGQTVAHEWRMPGSYLVVLEVSSGEFNASNRQKVSVATANVSISKIESGKSGSIAVKNSLADDVNISRWGLRSKEQTFTFPSPTIILAGATVYFANDTTGLDPDPSATELLYPNGLVASQFSPEAPKAAAAPASAPVSVNQNSKPSAQNNLSKSPGAPVVKKSDNKPLATAVSEPAASSTVIYSAAAAQSGTSLDWILALVGVVGVGAAGVLFSMKPKVVAPNNGSNEGENGDKPLRAEDFEIIEEKE